LRPLCTPLGGVENRTNREFRTGQVIVLRRFVDGSMNSRAASNQSGNLTMHLFVFEPPDTDQEE